MKTIDFLKVLESLEKPVFTTADVARIIGKHASYVRLYVHRLKHQERIEEVERGKYDIAETDPLCIASNIVFPSYISFLSGLEFYNATTQLPRTISVACAKPKNEIRREGYAIKFIKLKRSRLFGYGKERHHGKTIFVGELEKIIVDSLLLPMHCPISETFSALAEGRYDIKKLIRHAIAIDSVVVLKRLGHLLEKHGVDIYGRLKGRLNKRYDALDPLLPTIGEHDKKWRLIINETFEA